MFKVKRRIAIIIFTIVFILTGIGAFIVPITKISSAALAGSGSESSPYLITSTADLKAFRDDVNKGTTYAGKYVKLANDIDLKYATFTPIGAVADKPFKGTFDGDNHTIKGMYISVANAVANTTDFVGMFGHIDGATIKNLILEDENISITSATGSTGKKGSGNNPGKDGGHAVSVFAGGLVAEAVGSTISNVQASGFVNSLGGDGGTGGEGGTRTSNGTGQAGGKGGNGGESYSGGLVALADGCVISDCSFVGSIYAQGGAGGQGGAGYNARGGSYAGGAGGAGGYAGVTMGGGIVANVYNYKSTSANFVSGCYSNAYIRAFGSQSGQGGGGRTATDTSRGGKGGTARTRPDVYAGGIVGEGNGSIDNCFAIGSINLDASRHGMPGNGGYGSTSSTKGGNAGAVGNAAPEGAYAAAGGIVGHVFGEDGDKIIIASVYSAMEFTEGHQFYFYTDYNTRLAGIAGVIDFANTEISSAVSLSQYYKAEKSADGNAFSHFATFADSDVAEAVEGQADDIRYPNTYDFINEKRLSEQIVASLSAMGDRCKPIASLGNLSMGSGGVFGNFSKDLWQINGNVNDGRPTLKKLAFKEIEKKVYDVSTRDELLSIANTVSTGKPLYDVTINILEDFELGDWMPIGISMSKSIPFLVINGNNHTLSKMSMDKTTDYKGLVGYANNLVVKDLYIEDPYITGAGGSFVGGVAGYVSTSGQFNNCHVTQSSKPSAQYAIVTGKCYVGGLVGVNSGFARTGEIINCSNTVDVRCATGSNTDTSLYVGGLVGAIYNTDIKQSYCTAEVYCDAYKTALTYFAAAFVGGMFWNSSLENCFATGNLTTGYEGSYIGYVEGSCSDGYIKNNYYTGNVIYNFNGTVLEAGSGIRFGGMVARLRGGTENAKFQMTGNAALYQSFTLKSNAKKAEHRRFGDLFASNEPLRYTTEIRASKDLRDSYKYVRNNLVYDRNYYNSSRTRTYEPKTYSGIASHGYFHDTNGTHVSGYDYYAQTASDKLDFWQNTIGYDFVDVWDWNESLELPVLKTNAYSVPGMAGQAIEIATVEDLADFRDSVNDGFSYENKTIKLVADIDLSGIIWEPIGNSTTVVFTGTFDGDGHTISNLFVNRAADCKGLFGAVSYAEIKNLTVKNPTIATTAFKYTGGIVGWLSSSQMYNCKVIGGSIKAGADYVGGVVGYASGAGVVFEKCGSVYDPDATANTNLTHQIQGNNYVGGLIGNAVGTAKANIYITECYSSRTISSKVSYVGGLAGRAAGTNFDRCYTTGSVYTINGSFAGGIVGRIEAVACLVNDCFTTGDAQVYSTTPNAYAGGIAGQTNITGCKFTNCLVVGSISTCANTAKLYTMVSGIVGYANVKSTQIGGCAVVSDKIFASNYKNITNTTYFTHAAYFGNGNTTGSPSAISGMANFYSDCIMLAERTSGNATYCNTIRQDKGATEKPYEQFKTEGLYSSEVFGLGWDFYDIWEMQDGVNGGYPYLKALGAPVHDLGSKFNPIKINVKQDYIDLTNNVNDGISNYDGLYLLQTADINLADVDVIGYDLNHAFAGTYDGGSNRLTNFVLNDTSDFLGMFGYVKNATFKNINLVKPRITQTGTAAAYVGGIAAYSFGNLYIDSCAVLGGNISAQGPWVGGMVGIADVGYSQIYRSFSTANVTGGKNVGGLIGGMRAGRLNSCYSRANVSGTLGAGHTTGGLVGLLDNYGRVADCYAIGNVSDTSATVSAFAGGVVGRFNSTKYITVDRCYFNGTVTSTMTTKVSTNTTTSYAGGVVGYTACATGGAVRDCVSLATALNSVVPSGKATWQSAQIVCRSTSTATTHSGNFAISNTLVPYSNKSLNYGIHAPAANQLGAGLSTVEEALDYFKENAVLKLPSWEINTGDVWEVKSGLNYGFPALKNLPPDNSELDSLIDTAKTYKAQDWNTTTFAALQTVITAAEEASEAGTLEDSVKAFHIKALNDAIANLRPETGELEELYTEWAPTEAIKEWYVNYATMSSALQLSKQILDEDSNKYKNSDVQLTLSTLKMAINNLVVNKTKLNEAIILANLINAADYTEDDIADLMEVKMRAVTVNNDDNATAWQVKAITEELNEAIANLKVDKTNLASKITEAYTALGGTVTFTGSKDDGDEQVELSDPNGTKIPDSKFVNIQPFNDALSYAVQIYNDPDAQGTNVTKAVYELGVALYNLTINKAEITELYNLAELKLEEKYTADSWATFATAKTAAKAIIDQAAPAPADFKTFVASLDVAYNNLKNAMDGLKVDINQLKDLITEGQKEIDKNESESGHIYSEESIGELKEAIAKAQAVVTRAEDEDPTNDPTSQEIDVAAEELNEAILNLAVNIAFLQTKIAEANKYLNDNDVRKYYSESCMDNLQDARDAAVQFIEDYNAGEYEDIQEALAKAKQVTNALQSLLKNLEGNEELLQDYIDRVTDSEHENYIGNISYAQESVDVVTALANSSAELLASSDKTTDSVIKAIKDFEYAFAHMKGDKTALIAKVGEVSTWTNSKHRQDNDGKWILDDNGELKIFVVYLAETWNNLQEELERARDVVNAPEATVEQVETAYEDLIQAISDLRVDGSELAMRIEKAQNRLTAVDKVTGTYLYTEATRTPVAAEKVKAEAVMERIAAGTITLDEVQAQLDELNRVIDSMIINPDYINIYIEKAESQLLPQGDSEENNAKFYTEMSFRLLETQTNLVKGLINDNICEDDLYDFVDMLVNAMNGLEVITNALDEQVYTADSLEEVYITTATYAIVSEAVDAANAYLATNKWLAADYDDKFAAVEEMKDLVEQLKAAIDNIEVDKTAYAAFVNSKKPLLDMKYEPDGLESLSEAIDEALDAMTHTTANEELGYLAFDYYVAMDCISAILNAEKALRPDVSELQELIDSITNEMNEKHIAPKEDEEGNVIPDTVDPKYIGVVMNTYEYYTVNSYDSLLAALTAAQTVASNSVGYSIESIAQEVEKLQAAYDALVLDKSMLAELVADCILLEPEHYVSSSYNAFKAILDDCVEYLDGDDNDVITYVSTYYELLDAKEALVFDTSALKKLMERAQSEIDSATKEDGEEGKTYVTQGTLNNLIIALQAAENFDPDGGGDEEGGGSEEASAEAYRVVCKNLSDAIEGLIRLETLKLRIEEGRSYNNDDNDYDASAFAALQTAITDGVAVYDNPNATEAAIKNAEIEIATAIKSLSIGTSTLAELIAQAQAILDAADAEEPTRFFATLTLPDLREELAAAIAFRDSGNNDKLQELEVKDALYDAISGVIELTELKSKIDGADEFVTNNPNDKIWTATSYQTMLEVIEAARTLFNESSADENAVETTEADVLQHIANLSDLQGYLVELPQDAFANMFTLIDGNQHYKFIDEDGAEKEEHYVDDPAFLINIALNDTLADVIGQFLNEGVRAFNADGETEITDFAATKVATGIILRVYKNDEVVDQLTLVVKGDINGDGKANAVDMAQMNAHFVATKTLTGAYKLAADINGDGKVNAVDMAQLNAHFVGTKNMYDGLSVKEND